MKDSEHKYEIRRQRLLKLRDERCDGVDARLAERIGRTASYASRMLYPPGKAGRKRIGDDMAEVVEKAFRLPRHWLDGIEAGADIGGAAKPAGSEFLELSESQQLLLLACDGFTLKQYGHLMQAASWIAEGRQLLPVEPYDKKSSGGGR